MLYVVRSLNVCALVFVTAGCAGQARSSGATPATSASSSGNGVTLNAPVARRGSTLRVLVYHDMEGLAGQSDYRTFNYSHPEYYAKGQEYLAADINAVVDVVAPNVYVAIVCVGMHAKTGSRGFASHTVTIGMGLSMNGHATLSMLRGVPGVALSADGNEVAFDASDFQGAYDGLNALIGVARLAYPTTTNEVIREQKDNVLIARLQRERLMERWMDVESGRWSLPAPAAPVAGRKYYGAQ